VATHRTRREKETAHYNFLYSWTPSGPRVKRETKTASGAQNPKLAASKRADIQAKDEANERIKKDIIKSLILISFVLALELMVYLGWKKFFPVLG
jgi:hypothetical protein